MTPLCAQPAIDGQPVTDIPPASPWVFMSVNFMVGRKKPNVRQSVTASKSLIYKANTVTDTCPSNVRRMSVEPLKFVVDGHCCVSVKSTQTAGSAPRCGAVRTANTRRTAPKSSGRIPYTQGSGNDT